MSDMSSMNRERKKKQLRQRIITPQSQPRNQTPPAESEEEIQKARLKKKKRRLKVLAVVLLLLTVCVIAVTQYIKYYQFTGYRVVWEKTMKEGSLASYENFGNNVLKITRDGAAYIDSQGKEIWMQSYEMKDPVAYVNGNFAVVGDLQGNSIYVFDKAGYQGTVTTLLPIVRVTVSAHGVVGALMETSTANYIYLYKTDGTEIFSTMCLLNGEIGYPVDISLSPDGTQLIGAYTRLIEGNLYSRVAFHNFSEVGQNKSTRVVGGVDDLGATIVARVRFLTDTYSCSFADNGLAFFSTKNVMSPTLIKQVKIEETIKSIMYSDEYVGVIVDTSKGENPSRMDVYRANGDQVFSKEFNYQYKYADIDGDLVILYNEDSCEMFNMSGTLKFIGAFDFPVTKIRAGRYPNTLIVSGPQDMKEIKLQ